VKIIVTIHEAENGDVQVHIKNEAGLVTKREDRYATVITKSIKQHLAKEMPALVKSVLAQEN
jgi:hypothetical protein